MEETAEDVENQINEDRLAKMRIESSAPLSQAVNEDFELIFFIPQGVRLYTIEGTNASSPTADSSLQLLLHPEFYNEGTSTAQNTALIQVGTWLYPLSKETPILTAPNGTFVVANPTPDRPNLSIGIALSPEVDPKEAAELSELLSEYADLRELLPSGSEDEEASGKPRNGKSDKITNYLVNGGEKIAGKIQKKAAQWNKRIETRGERYRIKTEPCEKPAEISPVVKGGVVYMHKGTKTVAMFGERVFSKLTDLGQAVGKKVAAGATKVMGNSETAEKSIKVMGGGVAAVGSVFFSLVLASKALGKQVSTQAVENVRHKYGEEASETTEHAMQSVGHGAMFALQLSQATPHALISRVGMGAGVKTVSDLHTNLVGEPIPIRIPGLVPPAPVVEITEVERAPSSSEVLAVESKEEGKQVEQFQATEVLVHVEEKKEL